MSKKKVRRPGFVILIILFSVVLVCIFVLFLATRKQNMLMNPIEKDISALTSGLRPNSKGINCTPETIAAIAGTALASAEIPDLSILSAGGRFSGDKLLIAVAGTYRNFPVSALLKLSASAGEKPEIEIDGLSVGRLPLPRVILRKVLNTSMDSVELPLYITWAPPVFVIDLAKIPTGRIGLKSLERSGNSFLLQISLSQAQIDRTFAAVTGLLGRSGNIFKAEAEAGTKTEAMAATLETIAPLVSNPKNAVASVEYLEGKSFVQYVPDGEKITLDIGTVLFTGARISTDQDSVLEIRLSDRSLVQLKEKSKFILEKVGHTERENSEIALVSGSIRAKVAKLGGRGEYIIKTRTMVLGVRGTEFLVDAEPTGAIGVTVVEGSVEVAVTGEKTLVGASMETAVSADGILGKPTDITPEKFAQLEKNAIHTSFAVLDTPYESDKISIMWSIIRPALEYWNSLPETEQIRLEKEYGDKIDLSEISSLAGL